MKKNVYMTFIRKMKKKEKCLYDIYPENENKLKMFI